MLLYKAYVVFNVISCRICRVLRSTWHTFQCLSFILLVIVDWKYVFAFLEKYAPGISGLCYSYNDLLGSVFSSVYLCEPQPPFLNVFNSHEDIRPSMAENVLSSLGLIAAIFKIILAFSHYLKTVRSNMLSKKGKDKILSFCTLNFWNLLFVPAFGIRMFVFLSKFSICWKRGLSSCSFFFFPPTFPSLVFSCHVEWNRKLSPKMCSLGSGATSKMHQMSSYAHCEQFMKKLPQHFDHSQTFIMKVAGIERHL